MEFLILSQIRKGLLAPDMERDTPLCMHQYTRLFGTTRVPAFGRDRLVTDYASRHVAVLCRDRFYAFDVYDEHGRPLEVESLERLIAHIVHHAKSAPPVPSLGFAS